MAEYYPIMLSVRGRAAVVVGDSPFAREKAAALAEAGAIVRHFVEQPQEADIQHALIVVAVTDDATLIAWLHKVIRPHQLLNVMDRPLESSFVFTSVLRRGPLTVSVSTDGTAPAMARLVRQHIESLLGPEWEDFMHLAAHARQKLRSSGASFRQRVDFFEALMASDVLAHLQAGNRTLAERAVHDLHVLSAVAR